VIWQKRWVSDVPPSSGQTAAGWARELDALSQCLPCDICSVTFNSAPSIARLLESLDDHPRPAGVRIIDNSSHDDTVEVVRRVAAMRGLPLNFVHSQRNLGFPAATNLLLKQCDAEVVVLVNPDVEFRPGVLRELVALVASDRSIGIATCRLMTRDGRPQSEAARSRPHLRRLVAGELPRWIRALVRRFRSRDVGAGPLYEDRDVECASGALMAFRRQLLEEVGLLDESVFMFLEDIDFAARVLRAGYRIRYLGTSWVWHDSGVSVRGRESKMYALLPSVWLTYLRRYGRPSERLAARPVLLAVCVAATLRRLAHAEAPRGELLALWRALSHRPSKDPVW
jgi:GT2 family glycosyltransferase